MEDSLVVEMQERLRDGRLPCADAFALALEHHMAPIELAVMADAQGMRVGWCQLGLFVGAVKGKGWPNEPMQVAEEVRSALEGASVEGHLPCAHAWAIAQRFGWERLAIGHAANSLGIRIVQCQLRCFP